jgi:hypothetical protein
MMKLTGRTDKKPVYFNPQRVWAIYCETHTFVRPGEDEKVTTFIDSGGHEDANIVVVESLEAAAHEWWSAMRDND